jgi:exopolysaccharide biosynthesis protein
MTTNNLQENPFKLFLKVLVTFIAFLAITILLFGCASKPIASTHTIERIIEHKTDSVRSTQVNAAILDSLITKIAKVKTAKPECDSITQAALDQVLKQLNSRKKSGNNEAGIYYDELKSQIIAWQKIAETYSEKLATNKEKIYIKGDKQIVNVPVKYIPWWVEYLAYLGAATLLYVAYRISRIWI